MPDQSPDELLTSIANTVRDYRDREISKLTPEHVGRWASQFDPLMRHQLLSEMDHVLRHTYVTREHTQQYLRHLATHKKLTNGSPRDFWRNSTILDIQKAGRSQKDLRNELDAILRDVHGFGVDQCTGQSATFIYLDDCICSGNRVRWDLISWIQEAAPTKATVHIIVMGGHTYSRWFADGKITECINASGKEIDLTWWSSVWLENYPNSRDNSDVYWPTSAPQHEDTTRYINMLDSQGETVLWRSGNLTGKAQRFSSGSGRHFLEQQLLMAGSSIRQTESNLPPNMRPLGYSILKTLGFGCLLVTYRNCPNTAPLPLWVGGSWYPLFPRRNN